MSPEIPRLLRTGMHGAVATGVMSVVFAVARRRGAMPGKTPPRRIVAAVWPTAPRRSHAALAVALHLGIGVGAAIGYRIMFRGAAGSPISAAARGIAHGLATWAVGYCVVVPATGALSVAPRDRRDRQGMLLLAHAVYGATLGLLEHHVAERAGRR